MKLNKQSVLLGMSGGVDSTAAVILLQQRGYYVTGITFMFSGSNRSNEKTIADAKRVAEKFNIPHFIADLRVPFKETVIEYFKNEYVKGRTPFPCAVCNPEIKFHYLEKYARKYNCELIATGHYARIKNYNNTKYIYTGIDNDKDQSFFLWGIRKELLNKLIFPLGEFHKKDIKNILIKNGFKSITDKQESFGICFIEGNNYRIFLDKEGIKSEPGYFVDQNGTILGTHKGITNYTIGQRHGLGLNLNSRVFVSEFLLNENKIVLAEYNNLYKHKLHINNYYLIDKEEVVTGNNLTLKVRYRLQETPCRLNILDETRAEVELLKSEAMIAAGQTAVFYIGERLVGGGFIESAE